MNDLQNRADVVLKGGLLFDGSGTPPHVGDIALDGGRIKAMGDLSQTRGSLELDVTGLAVAPGFIDVHSHDDYAVIANPVMTAKLSQGITTVIVGNCGLSMAPLRFDAEPREPFNLLGAADAFRFDDFSAYVEAIDAARPAVNVAALVGHSTLRAQFMDRLDRPANPEELALMSVALARGLEGGAIGMSSGVYYEPARAADMAELIALARVVSAAGGVYTTHIRDEYDAIDVSLHEAFDTAAGANVPLVVSHHKCAGMQNWGRSTETLGLIETAARRAPVAFDCYPYTAGSSVLNPDLADGVIDILINSSRPHPECTGRYLKEIASDWGLTQREAAIKLLPGSACYFQIHEDDMQRILSHPSCMVGSDGLPNEPYPHPRLWGTFPRVLGRYSRDLSLFSLSEAIAKMTGLSAARFQLRDRGRLLPGMAADITVFNPATVADRATFELPAQQADGIEAVFVNGILSWSQGRAAAERAGRFIARDSATGD